MANIAQPQRQIHYISELKKIFVGRNNQPVTQKFKIDTNVSDDYYFQIVNKNNQIVSLAGRSFKVYGSYIDAKRQIHILFFTESFSIEDNVLHFHLNTNTNEYNEYITTEYKEIQFTIIETTGANTQVALRDVALAYRRPYIDQDTQVEIVYRDILTGITVPLTGSFGVGENINLFPGANSFAFGEGLITQSENQTVFGQYNEPDAEQLLIFGNGSDDNNRNNIFTVDKYGNAYLSGARILNNFDRTNVSQLNNDIGYITLAEVPVYEAGSGLKKSGTTFSLSATIPSAVSQLVNDTGFITGYTAGSGISIDDGVINCTVQGGGSGGATYTAGEGIGISDQNVISLTATIPSAVSQLEGVNNLVGAINGGTYISKSESVDMVGNNPKTVSLDIKMNTLANVLSSTYNFAKTSQIPTGVSQLANDNNYLSSISLYFPSVGIIKDTFLYFSNEFDYLREEITLDYNNVSGKLINKGFALTSQIPLSTSQLTNDSNFITTAALSDYATTGQLDAVSAAIPSQELLENVITGINCFNDMNGYRDGENPHVYILGTNDYGYATQRWVESQHYASADDTGNKDKTLIDNTAYGSDFQLTYNKDYKIFINTIATSDGILTINPVKGYLSDLSVGNIATFEHFIIPSGTLTGINIAEGIELIGELPDSFTPGYVQVFTRRIFKNSSKPALQQISYAYEFDNSVSIPTSVIPLTFKGTSIYNTVKIQEYYNYGGESITLNYSKNGGAWTAYTLGDQIQLNQNEIVAFSGANEYFGNGSRNYRIYVENGGVDVYGELMSLVDYSEGISQEREFEYLFENNGTLRHASGLILPQNTKAYCYEFMFNGCQGLQSSPALPAKTIESYACYRMFYGCSSLTSNIVIEAENIKNSGAQSIFENCSSITQAEVKATNMDYGSIFYGFKNCSNLSSITVHQTEWYLNGTNNSVDWVEGVAANGTFTKPSSLGEQYGTEFIPENWTVVNY